MEQNVVYCIGICCDTTLGSCYTGTNYFNQLYTRLYPLAHKIADNPFNYFEEIT